VRSERFPSGNWVRRTSHAISGSWISLSWNDPVRSPSEGRSDSSSSFVVPCDGNNHPDSSDPRAKVNRTWHSRSCPDWNHVHSSWPLIRAVGVKSCSSKMDPSPIRAGQGNGIKGSIRQHLFHGSVRVNLNRSRQKMHKPFL
jgi:hypothetical protein